MSASREFVCAVSDGSRIANSTKRKTIRVACMSKSSNEQRVLPTASVELQGDELGLGFSNVGQSVGIAARQPLHVAGFEVSEHGALTDDVAPNFEIADCDQQVRTGMMMLGECCSGLEDDFRSADAVFDE